MSQLCDGFNKTCLSRFCNVLSAGLDKDCLKGWLKPRVCQFRKPPHNEDINAIVINV